jgi:hypothetical protein
MKRVIGVAALLLLLNPVFGFAQQRQGWTPKDLAVAAVVQEAANTVLIVATWTSKNQFVEKFEWRIPELVIAGQVTSNLSDSVTVSQPMSDTDAQFCVKTIRESDLKESVETCEPFVLPGVPVLPPDSVRIEVQVARVDVMTFKWDTIAGTQQYFAEIEREGLGRAAAFVYNVYQHDAHCVGSPTWAPHDTLRTDGLQGGEVFS